jgi:hypothetical protein
MSSTLTSWTCVQLQRVVLSTAAVWMQLNCSSPAIPVFGPAGGLWPQHV